MLINSTVFESERKSEQATYLPPPLLFDNATHNVWQVMHQIHQNNLIKDITQTKNHQAELMQNCTIQFLRLFIGT